MQLKENQDGYGNERIKATYSQWKNSKSIEDGTLYFMRYFESPASKITYNQNGTWGQSRLARAKKYYNQFHGREVPVGDSRIGTIKLSGDKAAKMMQLISEAIRIADDNRYTYSQGNRYGEFQYDCSSFVARLYKKYFNFTAPSSTSGYPGCGYRIGSESSVDLQPGDVLWKSRTCRNVYWKWITSRSTWKRISKK